MTQFAKVSFRRLTFRLVRSGMTLKTMGPLPHVLQVADATRPKCATLPRGPKPVRAFFLIIQKARCRSTSASRKTKGWNWSGS